MRFGWLWLVLAFIAGLLIGSRPASAFVPARALPYERALIRETEAVYGLNGPVAVFAGQIEQESQWKPRACSPFACGLTQFTPATARTISRQYPDQLGAGDVFNPEWAIRALVLYDRDLFKRTPKMATECDDWAVTLSAYNGGLKWVARDQALAKRHGADPTRWWGNVERWSPRAPKYTRENRGYPRIILLTNQFHYESWGGTVQCQRAA